VRVYSQAFHYVEEGSVKVYLAGPMRGYPLYNFPAFDDAARRLRSVGIEVLSPAEHDRETGFNEKEDNLVEALTASGYSLKTAILWDLATIADVDAVIALPGWTGSAGAKLEKCFADFLGVPFYQYRALGTSFTLLDEDAVA
jgi:hypothetical protein